ncbi:hypothetical protein HW115_16385 [Verrucomicrobiaceae bacterium N1E253]|uniref:Glycosyltransferase family 9 protein n=1 Tax=Oceaniferula marina TaxID=2748318 RepID=A0A851GJL4_9BACT|nr:hypothetical protein [Oceaniferula marina]NWK57202.1 hypothetical protein [Oceaniferula marina]
MSTLPDAAPIPEEPARHLKGGVLLVVAPVDLAEAFFSVPAVRALKHFRPMGSITVLCVESQREMWDAMPEVDAVVDYPLGSSARKLHALIKGGESTHSFFDSAVLWEPGAAALAVMRARVLQRFGYPAKGLVKCLTDPVERVTDPGPIEHRVRYYLGLVQELGADAFVRQNFQTIPLPEKPRSIRIAVAVESEYGSAYQWPEAKLETLKHAMEEKYGAVQWVAIRKGEPLIPQLQSCTALLASDGEVAHWASFVGLPAVVVFGPGEPDWKRPLGKQSLVVREHVACSPCYLAECPMDHRCMDGASVERVMAALESAMAERS